MTRRLSVILPAHDEAEWIEACLAALFASDPLPEGWTGEVLVVANGCADDTAKRARAMSDATSGWDLAVIERTEGGKPGALSQGDTAARGTIRAYLDADVRVDPPLMAQLVAALDCNVARYASGTPRLTRAHSAFTRAYGRFWVTLPFVTHGVPGFGLFAMNDSGRARWGAWPEIISDDTFARLSFAPDERIRVPAGYGWPPVEGLGNLVRVRRRQNRGVDEISRLYPDLAAHDDTPRIGMRGLLRRLLADPAGFAAYALVSLAVKTPLFGGSGWTRGR